MESYNITVRYIGLGAIGVAALALIVAALLCLVGAVVSAVRAARL